MKDNRNRHSLIVDIRKVDETPEEGFLSPSVFQHADLLNAIFSGSRINKETLINKVNRIHFMDDSVHVLLRHPRYDEMVLVRAIPEAVEEDELTCSWDKGYSGFGIEHFQFRYLVIMGSEAVIVIPAKLVHMDAAGIRVCLPEVNYLISKREENRHGCRDVGAEITQNGFDARGNLADFNSSSLRIRIGPQPPASHHMFNPGGTATVRLSSGDKMIFSGQCRCVRQKYDSGGDWEIVLAPLNDQISRFRTKKRRHPRQKIFPPPTVMFEHPFSRKSVRREIVDLSITGFSLYDDPKDGIFVPGMIIQDLSIIYAGEMKMNGTAQVLSRKKTDDGHIVCGLAILDMDIHSYSRLNHILSLNSDPRACISMEVDMDDLWEFFFDTGFIYPQKYKLLQEHREQFKDTYRKLYQDNPEIARHFTYQHNGRIYGHMSMIRAYERAWLIHHHAARTMEDKRPGLLVLKQMILFLYGMYHLPSVKLDYIMLYFRPENEFPNIVFGDFAKEVNNPRICSLDLFSYTTFPVAGLHEELPAGWSLHESTQPERWEWGQFYKRNSGGLLLDALESGQKCPGNESLEDTARRLGFLRKWNVYSLTQNHLLKAVLVVDQSDVGINMSELLNSIKIFVVDGDGLTGEILSHALHQLTPVYRQDHIPVLMYPVACSDEMGMPCEKSYQLLIMSGVDHEYEFMEYMQHRFRIKYE